MHFWNRSHHPDLRIRGKFRRRDLSQKGEALKAAASGSILPV